MCINPYFFKFIHIYAFFLLSITAMDHISAGITRNQEFYQHKIARNQEFSSGYFARFQEFPEFFLPKPSNRHMQNGRPHVRSRPSAGSSHCLLLRLPVISCNTSGAVLRDSSGWTAIPALLSWSSRFRLPSSSACRNYRAPILSPCCLDHLSWQNSPRR